MQPLWKVANKAIANQRSPDPAVRTQTSLAICRHVWSTEGPVGFYRGVLPSLVMVSNPIITFFLFEHLSSR